MQVTTAQFAVRLSAAISLGSLVGLERQWRQRMAGTRTNALVAAGAAAFVMAGTLLENDATAAGRMASYVVSGVGFLGAGVIFKDGANVRGLNTAATIWCSAAIGVLGGLGALHLALVLGAAVLLTNTVLRPLAYRLHPVLPASEPAETLYELTLVCREADEASLRALLLNSISQAPVMLQAIHGDDEGSSDRSRLRAEISTVGRKNEEIERLAMRLSIEPGVTSLSWSVVPTGME